MSIQSELARLTNAKAAIQTAIEGKGVTVPGGALLDGMALMGFPTAKYLQCVVWKMIITQKIMTILYQQYWLIVKHLLRHQMVQ